MGAEERTLKYFRTDAKTASHLIDWLDISKELIALIICLNSQWFLCKYPRSFLSICLALTLSPTRNCYNVSKNWIYYAWWIPQRCEMIENSCQLELLWETHTTCTQKNIYCSIVCPRHNKTPSGVVNFIMQISRIRRVSRQREYFLRFVCQFFVAVIIIIIVRQFVVVYPPLPLHSYYV